MEEPYGEVVKIVGHYEIRYVASVKSYVLYNTLNNEYVLWSNRVSILESEIEPKGGQLTLF